MDCTGHGVPGAFTAMLMTSFFGSALDLTDPWDPGRVLADVNRRVKEELGQTHRKDDGRAFGAAGGKPGADEGMDATCLWLDLQSGEGYFAGARHSLWVFKADAAEPEEIKGDRIGVGYSSTPDEQAWSNQAVRFAQGHDPPGHQRRHHRPDRRCRAGSPSASATCGRPSGPGPRAARCAPGSSTPTRP